MSKRQDSQVVVIGWPTAIIGVFGLDDVGKINW